MHLVTNAHAVTVGGPKREGKNHGEEIRRKRRSRVARRRTSIACGRSKAGVDYLGSGWSDRRSSVFNRKEQEGEPFTRTQSTGNMGCTPSPARRLDAHRFRKSASSCTGAGVCLFRYAGSKQEPATGRPCWLWRSHLDSTTTVRHGGGYFDSWRHGLCWNNSPQSFWSS